MCPNFLRGLCKTRYNIPGVAVSFTEFPYSVLHGGKGGSEKKILVVLLDD